MGNMKLSKTSKCISCSQPPNVILRANAFCNTCFTNNFKKKIRKSFSTIGVNPFYIHIEKKSDVALAYVVSDVLRNRVHNCQLLINNNLVGVKNSYDLPTYKTKNQLDGNTYIINSCTQDDLAENLINCVLYNRTDEFIKHTSAEYTTYDEYFNKECVNINLLKNVSNRELALYLYINDIEYKQFIELNEVDYENQPVENTTINHDENFHAKKVKAFLAELTDKNYST